MNEKDNDVSYFDIDSSYISKCADFFDVSLDALVHLESNLLTSPSIKGTSIFATVTVGERGEIHFP
ncbi:Cro/Cl family transcriptional regulator, partial [Streptococcus pseudopneumoniae]|uniref:Cro/Cl family transcriptional regulator n=1 Tax=Streptococcus pseudopneumoniae TaxID=257758 RepID=UPI0019D4FC45